MSSSGPPKDKFFANIMNPYMNELKMHPKELVLKDGKVQVEDVRGPAGEGSQEERMKKLEQEVSWWGHNRCHGMAKVRGR